MIATILSDDMSNYSKHMIIETKNPNNLRILWYDFMILI